MMTFAATRHVRWALDTPEIRLRLIRAANAFFNVFTARQTCRVAANLVLPRSGKPLSWI